MLKRRGDALATCTSKRVYRRGRNWYVDLRWSDGRRERRSGGHTKAQAEKLAQKRIAEEARGALALSPHEPAGEEPGPAFDALADRYLEHLRVYGKDASIDAAHRSLHQLTQHFWDADASKITAADVDRFVARRKTTCQAATINKDLRYLKAALRFAVEGGALKEMPCRVRMVREIRKAPTILSRAELHRLLENAGRLRAMFLLAAMTGLRNAEIRFLTWADVDLTRGVIHVRVKPGFSPKSGSERAVPLNSVLIDVLRSHRKTLPHNRRLNWVFQRNPRSASQWPPSPLCAAVRKAFTDAGLGDEDRKPGLHMLRRSFCSHSLARGASIEAVRAMGGWSSLAVVQRYAVSGEDERRLAVERLADLASGDDK